MGLLLGLIITAAPFLIVGIAGLMEMISERKLRLLHSKYSK
jgi:hypothetical protein